MPKNQIISPFAKWYNANGFNPLRIFVKNRSATHHNTIVPVTEKRGTLILGAVPTQSMLDKISEENGGLKVARVSLLTSDEESSINYDVTQKSIHMSLFDHSAMDAKTGENITLAEVKSKMDEVAGEMNAGNVVYFHCMAGHSRSCFGVTSFLYLHPEFLAGVSGNFGNPPSLQEIASFVKQRRPEVTELEGLKSGQKGLLGIIALNQHCERLRSRKEGDLNLDVNTVKRITQDIAFMLHAPLDHGFRDESDRTKQEENFAELYTACKQAGHNILLNLLPEGLGTLERFNQLSPSEQAHFAILAQNLVSRGAVTQSDLEAELGCSLVMLAQKAAESRSKLTAGDQVELLRSFGVGAGLGFTDIAARIVAGNSVDKYNAGVQLAELLHVAQENNLLPGDKKVIERFVDQLSAKELSDFENRLIRLGMEPRDFLKDGQNRIAVQGRQVTQNPLVQKKTVEEEKTQEQAPSPPSM